MFRRLLVPCIALIMLAGCATTPRAAEVVGDAPEAVELVDLWRVTGAEGESVDTWLRLDAGEFQLWRECGLISGSWRAAEGLMLASIFGANGTCAADGIPAVPWLEAVVGYRGDADGWELVDAAGSSVASLSIDGAPESRADADPSYTRPPEVTAETRAFFATPPPLPGTLTPGPVDGRWVPDAVATGTDAGVEFSGDGRWTGSDGCNGGEGRWALGAKGSFLATSGASTLVYCDGAAVPSWVATAQLAGFDGDVLVLLDADGAELGRLIRA